LSVWSGVNCARCSSDRWPVSTNERRRRVDGPPLDGGVGRWDRGRGDPWLAMRERVILLIHEGERVVILIGTRSEAKCPAGRGDYCFFIKWRD
jgi:hypothetical protein